MADNSTSIGDNSARVIHTEREFDPAYGMITTQTYEGSEVALTPLHAQFRAIGYQPRMFEYRAPVYRMRVKIGATTDGGAPKVSDIWERATELAFVDVRLAPKLIEAAGSTATLNNWVKQIKDAIKNGTALPAGAPATQVLLHEFMSRGGEGYEVKRPVLRRRRTMSMRGGQISIAAANPVIYTTAALVRDVPIPVDVASRLPVTPTYTPTNTVWGWKLRVDEQIHLRYLRRREEVREWVFAAWSTLTTDVIT